MGLVILPQHWSAFLCIFLIAAVFLVGYIRGWLMTHTLIIANFVVFMVTLPFYREIVYGFYGHGIIYAGLGFRPIYLSSISFIPEWYTFLTSMFIHGGFFHIFGNMLVLFFVGSAFEERIGAKKLLLIFIVTGIFGAVTHSILDLSSAVPLIGASGAIFGLMGAFAYAYPRDEVVMPIGIGIMFLTRIKVIYAVLFFALIETFVVWLDVPDGTAHLAHLGGLVSGVILAAIILRKPRVREYSSPEVIYPMVSVRGPHKWNYSNLRKLAVTPELEDILDRIQREDLPQVQEIWLEHFLEKTICPRCGAPLQHFNGKIWCENCGFKTSY